MSGVDSSFRVTFNITATVILKKNTLNKMCYCYMNYIFHKRQNFQKTEEQN